MRIPEKLSIVNYLLPFFQTDATSPSVWKATERLIYKWLAPPTSDSVVLKYSSAAKSISKM